MYIPLFEKIKLNFKTNIKYCVKYNNLTRSFKSLILRDSDPCFKKTFKILSLLNKLNFFQSQDN